MISTLQLALSVAPLAVEAFSAEVGAVRVFFPILLCVILSIVLTVVLNAILWLR